MKPSFKTAFKRLPGMDAAAGLVRYVQYRRALGKAVAAEPAAADVPPPHLRYRVHRSFDREQYLETGRVIAASITRALVAAGLEFTGRAVLDLGSGPGRVARWLKSEHPEVHLTCADIDAEAIAWANAHTPAMATFVTTPHLPPLPFAPAQFDAVYCVSLFTHLDESMQDVWLHEIARILKPGGLLLATTHGERTTASCSAQELEQLHTNGFVFRKQGALRVKLDGLPTFYQTSFHTRRYVLEHWSMFLEVVSHLPGGIQQHQDVVVLRKPDRPE